MRHLKYAVTLLFLATLSAHAAGTGGGASSFGFEQPLQNFGQAITGPSAYWMFIIIFALGVVVIGASGHMNALGGFIVFMVIVGGLLVGARNAGNWFGAGAEISSYVAPTDHSPSRG